MTTLEPSGPPAATRFPVQLGTVHFGMPYGFRNDALPLETSLHLMDRAWDIGIRTFDTAEAYGHAESVVGAWVTSRKQTPEIVSKFSPLSGLAGTALRERLERRIQNCLREMGVSCIDVMLAHDQADMLRDDVMDILLKEVERGRIRTLGASVYEPSETLRQLETSSLEFIQAPSSIVDSRQFDEGAIGECESAGIRFVGRSVYLQGVVGSSPDDLAPHLHDLAGPVRLIREAAGELGIALHALAVAFPLIVYGQREVVIGASAPEHFDAIIQGLETPAVPDAIRRCIHDACAGLPLGVLDPRRWPRKAVGAG